MRTHRSSSIGSSSLETSGLKQDFRKQKVRKTDTQRRTYLKKISQGDFFYGGNDVKKNVIALFWFKLTHSVFADIMKDPAFWICNATFWIIRYLGFTNSSDAMLQEIPIIGVTALSFVHRLLVFCLVFYVTQCYTRLGCQY